MHNDCTVAYFSMEIAVDPGIPSYAGGLGILAGDTVRSAADMALPMVAVTLLHRKGYFFQRLDASGWQSEEPVEWVVEDFLEPLEPRVEVQLDGKPLHIRAWRYIVRGVSGGEVPVLFLDTDLPENDEWRRRLTDHLYGGDSYYRLCQEVVLGIGGVRVLRALGLRGSVRFHMNEGHASLLALELLEESRIASGRDGVSGVDVERVRQQCVFTTHTPVPAGHDKFPVDLARRVVGLRGDQLTPLDDYCTDGQLNMTLIALNLSGHVNGVAQKHGEVSRAMFVGYEIDAITNGVHANTWVSQPFQALFDKYLSDWRANNFVLRSVLSIPPEDVWAAHMEAKAALIQMVNRETNAGLDVDALTLGFARRAAPYKRGSLPLSDPGRLKAIAESVGAIQFIYAGKAHPGDDTGRGIIQRIVQAEKELGDKVRVVYLPNYDMELGKLLTSGVDIWLNTPQPPLEASGTSGMKAALNAVPSFSVLDGWWIEGWIEGVTGWAIGEHTPDTTPGRERWDSDAKSFYDTLESKVAPMFYGDRGAFIGVMRHTIALNGAFFNTQRMLQEYVVKAYFV